ncbi:hypothetical protein LBMAG49_07600 [Planctomycetota bacterium]|nr:hypothetical protein LBMAG49_07600 [Planctomycetota bacterium]
MTLDVAVVIPAFNAAAFLPAALNSLRAQTVPPKEVVVVDDGSTDETASIARANGATLVQQQQRGPGAARNRGIQVTKAPLIAFLDADDWFAPNKLERQCERLGQLGVAACCTGALVVEQDRVTRSKNAGHVVPEILTFERLLKGNPVICSSMLLRRDALLRSGVFDEDPLLIATEDYDLWLRIVRNEPIAYLAEPLTFYRVHQNSLSANTRFLRGIDRIMDKVSALPGADPREKRQIALRRADARLDLAWDLVQATGRAREARGLIRESLGHAVTWKGCRMWLRSLIGG